MTNESQPDSEKSTFREILDKQVAYESIRNSISHQIGRHVHLLNQSDTPEEEILRHQNTIQNLEEARRRIRLEDAETIEGKDGLKFLSASLKS